MAQPLQLSFEDKVVVVTGSTRGIGYTIGEIFVRAGASVVVNGRSEETVQLAVQGLTKLGGKVYGIPADLGKSEDVERLIEDAAAHLGRIDILVNNAAIGFPTPFNEISDAEWDYVSAVNLRGSFQASRAVVPHMKKAGGGSIIMIASRAAFSGSQYAGVHYTASKGGLLALTFALAREVGPFYIRVNAVIPGFTWTDITAGAKQEEWYRSLLRATPLRRGGKPEDIANVCLFLASDLSSFISGQAIPVNGGMT